MSRVCDVTGRKPMYGNNVSHAHNKSRRRFDINLQKKRFWLSDEKRWITLKVSTQGLRLIDKIGILNLEVRIEWHRGQFENSDKDSRDPSRFRHILLYIIY